MKRTPIKIRKSVYRDYCDCHDVGVFMVSGVPQLTVVDGLSDEQFLALLDDKDLMTGIYMSEPVDQCWNKLQTAIQRGLPVTLRTEKPVSEAVLEQLRQVPHSALHLATGFTENPLLAKISLGCPVVSFREMAALAKSYKIHIGLHLMYMPHLVDRLDLYEAVDIMKNYVGHIILTLPDIPDDTMRSMITAWECVKPSSIPQFKKFYQARVFDRTWQVKPKHREEIVSGLADFIKAKKITAELIGGFPNQHRTRHVPLGSSNPLGMSTYLYEKTDKGMFQRVSGQAYESNCGQCGKTLYL